MLIVTTEAIPGYQIRHVIGEVIGVTMRSRNPYLEGIKELTGSRNPEAVRLLTRWRTEAVAAMETAARERGANAVIGVRFDHRTVTDLWVELCAYGTAVVAVPVGRARPRPPGARPMTPHPPMTPPLPATSRPPAPPLPAGTWPVATWPAGTGQTPAEPERRPADRPTD